MGVVWAWMIVFTFVGPEMTEQERAEEAEHARNLESMRKQGMSMRDIGEEMARVAWEAEKGAGPEPENGNEDEGGPVKEVGAEHVDLVGNDSHA